MSSLADNRRIIQTCIETGEQTVHNSKQEAIEGLLEVRKQTIFATRRTACKPRHLVREGLRQTLMGRQQSAFGFRFEYEDDEEASQIPDPIASNQETNSSVMRTNELSEEDEDPEDANSAMRTNELSDEDEDPEDADIVTAGEVGDDAPRDEGERANAGESCSKAVLLFRKVQGREERVIYENKLAAARALAGDYRLPASSISTLEHVISLGLNGTVTSVLDCNFFPVNVSSEYDDEPSGSSVPVERPAARTTPRARPSKPRERIEQISLETGEVLRSHDSPKAASRFAGDMSATHMRRAIDAFVPYKGCLWRRKTKRQTAIGKPIVKLLGGKKTYFPTHAAASRAEGVRSSSGLSSVLQGRTKTWKGAKYSYVGSK